MHKQILARINPSGFLFISKKNYRYYAVILPYYISKMKRIAPIFLSLWLLLLLFSSCKNQSEQFLPKPLTDTIPIDVPISTFNIPVHYSLADLENFLNGKIQAEFLETVISPTKNEKDQVKIEMKKAGRIQLTAAGEELRIVFPLQVTATILESRANFITKGIKPVVTILELTLQTPADLDSRWNLVTHFSIENMKWVQKPVVRIAGIPIDLTEKVEEALEKNKSKLTTMLDQEINKAVSLSKPVGKIWTDLQKPMIVLKKPPHAYIKFITKKISGNLELKPTELRCYTTIQAQVAMISETNMRVPLIPLPPFKKQGSENTASEAFVYAFAELDRVNESLNEKLNGFRIQKEDKTLILRDPFVYASDSGLTIDVKTEGNINGHLVATVQPQFDSVAQRMQLNNFEFKLVTDNMLLNMGDAILHNKIRDTLQSFLIVGLDTLIMKIPSIIENAIAKGKTGRTIDIDVEDFSIHSCKILMDARRLHFIVHTTFTSDLEIKHLKSGEGIKIKPRAKPQGKPDE